METRRCHCGFLEMYQKVLTMKNNGLLNVSENDKSSIYRTGKEDLLSNTSVLHEVGIKDWPMNYVNTTIEYSCRRLELITAASSADIS